MNQVQENCNLKFFFFGNLASTRVAYVIHQCFSFCQSQSKIGVSFFLLKFLFLEIRHQNMMLMSSTKISFFGNPASKYVTNVTHQNFLFWKFPLKMGSLCNPSNFLFWKSGIKMCHLCHPSIFPFLANHMTCLSNPLISPFGLSSN